MATETLTTSGIWICPAHVNKITIECWGAGGNGGAGGPNDGDAGGGGAGGQYAILSDLSVTPSFTYGYTVGTPGQNTEFASVAIACLGENGEDFAAGGTGGVGSSTGGLGSNVYAGGSGADGVSNNSGGGGGGAGSTGVGSAAGGITGGTSTVENGGTGGNGYSGTDGSGTIGANYGGGGGGAVKTGAIGQGAQGLIRLTYNYEYILNLSDIVSLNDNTTSSSEFFRALADSFTLTDDTLRELTLGGFKIYLSEDRILKMYIGDEEVATAYLGDIILK